MRISRIVAVLSLLVVAACSKKPDGAASATTDSMGGMAGMQMAMAGMEMMPGMRAHLDSLAAMSPAQLAAMMAGHQDLASRMMDAMGADMRGMGMHPDSAWIALGDSVRQDLADLSGLTGAGLQPRVQAHIARMQRMLTTHEGMMKM